MNKNNQPFLGPGLLQANLANDLLRASWRRCVSDYRLDPAARHDVAIAGASSVLEIRQSMEEIVHDTQSVIKRIRHIAQDVGYVLLLSSPEGVVFESFADSVQGEEIELEGLTRGSVWNEHMVGTNGIGTALVSRQPVTVHGKAHFNNQFRTFTCSAAPVFGSDGRVVAVIDLSGRANGFDSAEYRFAEYFVREAAAQASMIMFQKEHKADCLVALSNEPDSMPMKSRAVVAASEDGKILGATPEAFALLGVPELRDLGDRTLQDVLQVSIQDLQPLNARNTPLKLKDGVTTYATTYLPDMRHQRGGAKQAISKRTVMIPARTVSESRHLDRVDTGDPAVHNIVGLCRKIINKDLPVLILGETGVGKDTLARCMHDESERSSRPYVAVNCAAIPATLLASELFGYAPGSFTGASRTGRVGKIQASDSGTLFLDEIGDMPLDLQAHLLRVLEERVVTPLGSTEAIPVDLHIICATHCKLSALVEQGRFRSDLYFRIRGIQFTMPSLRDRTDIEEVAARIMSDEAASAGRLPPQFAPEVLEMFGQYPWPGNIRELRSLIRLLLSVHSDQLITLEHLSDDMFQWGEFGSVERTEAAGSSAARSVRPVVAAKADASALSSPTLAAANDAAEESMIVETLGAFKWNVTDAARKLGISRATLHRKIRKFGIVSPNNQN